MRGRVLIIVGVLLLLVLVLGFVFFGGFLDTTPAPTPGGSGGQAGSVAGQGGGGAQDGPTPTPTNTPQPLVNIVIAVQELPRGIRIPPEALAVRPFPEAAAPFNAVTDIEAVAGRIARTDIFREQPILSNLVVEDFEALATNLGRVGSDAAAVLPSNLVAVSMPIDRLTGIAYAVQDGDRVDVIVSMLFVDVDEAFQSIEPNNVTLFQVTEDGGITLTEGIEGRPDTSSLGTVIVGPREEQRPRLATQRTIQDALVVHVGEFPADGRFIGIPPTPTPVPEEIEEEDAEGPPPPTPVPPRPDIITLGVTPQEAVLLVWAIESRLPLTLALRAATDTSRVPTESVTLTYFLDEYRITLPQRRDFALTPANDSIRRLDIGSTISFGGGGGGDN